MGDIRSGQFAWTGINVSEAVTAKHVAKLHQEDLKIQDHFGPRPDMHPICLLAFM